MSERRPLLTQNTDDRYQKPDIYKERIVARRPSWYRLCSVMMSCLVLQGLTIGTEYGLPVMYVEILEVFKTSRAEAALIQSVYSGMTVGGGILLSWLVVRIGPGSSTVVGSLLASIGFIASALATNLITVIVCTGLIAGLGMGVAYLSSFITIGWMFHKDAGIPLVLLTVGSSVGHVLMPFLFNNFITRYQWNGTFLVFGAILLNAVICGVHIYYSKDYMVTGNDVINRRKSYDTALFTDAVLMNILFCSFLQAVTGITEPYFIVDILGQRGYSMETGSFFASLIGIANLGGRLIAGLLRLFVKKPSVYHWSYICPLLAVSHLLIPHLNDYWSLLGAILLYGITYGITFAQTPTIIYETSGLGRYPQAIAMNNVVYGAGMFIGGIVGGAIKDATGSYDAMLYLAAGSAAFVSLSTIIMQFVLKLKHSKRFVMKVIEVAEQRPDFQIGTETP